MASANDIVRPSRDEKSRYELRLRPQWDRWLGFGADIGQLGLLIPLTLDIAPDWFSWTEHDERWRREYVEIVDEINKRRRFVIEHASELAPSLAGVPPDRVLFEAVSRRAFIRWARRHWKLPPEMLALLDTESADNPATSPSSPQSSVYQQTARRNASMSAEIERACQQARDRGLDRYDVHVIWNLLKEAALNGQDAFTGMVCGKGLEYLRDEGATEYLTKNAVRKRLERRAAKGR
ncbi:hypothetical protein OKW33_000423 [Paraburkholderia atlantica]|uniref:hypothetical protein n=1 Tax=Paraburkholderia atlantica TaxID=2654982 RepID=UPI003D240112